MRRIIAQLQHICGHIASAMQPASGGSHAVMDEWSDAKMNDWCERLQRELDAARDMIPGFVYTVPFDSNGSYFSFRLTEMDYMMRTFSPHGPFLRGFVDATEYMARTFLTD